jgi:hypothetical protein
MKASPLLVTLLLVTPPLLLSCNPDDPLGDAAACEQDSDCFDDGQGNRLTLCNGTPSCEIQVFATDRGPWNLKLCVWTPPPCGEYRCSVNRQDEVVCDFPPDVDRDGSESMASGGLDCDDNDATRAPSMPEVCDADDLDEDCDSTTFGDRDADQDGAQDSACCNEVERGERVCGTDCDDQRPAVHPGAVEVCDQIDNDCDGAIDEQSGFVAYTDADGDGWGVGDATVVCDFSGGYASTAGDCDDTLSQIHPGAFLCVGSGTGEYIDICDVDGTWNADVCPGLGLCVPQPDGTGVCFPGDKFPACSDNVDNDDDGLIDWRDPECSSPLDNTEGVLACANGTDDDKDGLRDFPNDPGCASPEDVDEEDPATAPVCANGLDDDNDGTVDYVVGTGDPGCVSAADDSEREVTGAACDNGIDEDAAEDKALAIDFPADKDCSGPNDDGEVIADCRNGIDDDLDGQVDFAGNDPGCASAADRSERQASGNYPCDNGVDDDGNGAADYPGDLGCTSPFDLTEAPTP